MENRQRTAVMYEAPIPIELPRPGLQLVLRRGASTLAAAGAEGALYIAGKLARRSDRTVARAARRTFERLGATYVKFGQAVASSPAMIPPAIAEEFRSCLDKGPPVPWAQVREIVQEDLGAPVDTLFAAFDRRPHAAASIAVVHRARLHDGREVAVKVLRPGMASVVAADLQVMEPFARFLARQGIGEAGNAVAYLVGLRTQIAEELDLRNEVRTMAHFRALFQAYGLERLVIPEVHAALCGPRVLTMEYIDGAPIDDLAKAREYGVDPRPLVRELLRAWVLTALRSAVFHADIHAGNLFLMKDGRLAMLDWGIVARLDADSQELFRALCESALGREEAWDVVTRHIIRAQGVLLQEGFAMSDDDVKGMVRMFMEPILTKPMKDVSMGALFMSPEQARELNHGEAAPKRSLRERWRQNRVIARAFRKAMKAGHFEEEVQRQTFLAAKQLIYLERYGRMYTPDEALLGDKAFLEMVLGE
ncbi:MAG: ABC1 kinase family protein [Dehalococcoidia bacterium]